MGLGLYGKLSTDADTAYLKRGFHAHAAEQRGRCADAAIVVLQEIGFQVYDIGEERIRAAIINATGKK